MVVLHDRELVGRDAAFSIPGVLGLIGVILVVLGVLLLLGVHFSLHGF